MNKPYKKPNLHARRFRPKKTIVINKQMHIDFITKYPAYGHITVTDFKKIIDTFNEELYKGIIGNRDGVELPESLGFIFLGTCKSPKKKNVDIVKSIELGTEVLHKNWESDNNLLKIFYTNHTSKYPLQNKQVWSFKAVKKFRQAASVAYKEDWSRYISIDSTRKISTMFAKLRKKDFIIKQIQAIPDGYNEFIL